MDAVAAAAATVAVGVDADQIAGSNVNGLTFKGFGVLSANSTSALLMDYKAQQPAVYAQLLQILFGGTHPIMNTVKIEMGDDRNTSTGPEPATMRTADEAADVAREPGFQLAADAKKYNPNLKVDILRWYAPAWANTNDKIYTWYKDTILAAYRQYGYMVDYVNPGVNESTPDLTWTEQYVNLVRTDTTGYISSDPALAGFRPGEADLYHQIKVVISDEAGLGSFGDNMVADSTLRDAVAAAGYHYTTADDSAKDFTKLAEQYDKEVWNSEAQVTFSNSSFRPNNNTADPTVAGTGIGGINSPLEMADTVVKGFVDSRRTNFIYQPAIGSFYEGGQYSYKELVSARDPWSGWIHYDAGLAVLQHFSDFAVTGWENSTNTAGIWRVVPQASAAGATGTNPVNGRNGSPNYMTLAAPDKSNFSTVVVNDSEYAKTYKITPQNFTYGAGKSLQVWETRACRRRRGVQRQLQAARCRRAAERKRHLHRAHQAVLDRHGDLARRHRRRQLDHPPAGRGAAHSARRRPGARHPLVRQLRLLEQDRPGDRGRRWPVRPDRAVHRLARWRPGRHPAVHLGPQRRLRGVQGCRRQLRAAPADRPNCYGCRRRLERRRPDHRHRRPALDQLQGER